MRSTVTTTKVWTQPHLIILGQGKPEENVLAVCKSHGHLGAPLGPTISRSNCNEATVNCGACQANGGGAS